MQAIQQANYWVGWVELVPAETTEVSTATKLVVVVVVRFAHHQKVERQQIFSRIIDRKVYIPISVGIPVDNGSVNGTHQKVNRQQSEKPDGRSVIDIHEGIRGSPSDADWPAVAQPLHKCPVRYALLELCRNVIAIIENVVVELAGFSHHIEEAIRVGGRVRVLLSIGMSMVQA